MIYKSQAEWDGYVPSAQVKFSIDFYLSGGLLHRVAWWLYNNTDWFYEMVKGISIIAMKKIEEVDEWEKQKSSPCAAETLDSEE